MIENPLSLLELEQFERNNNDRSFKNKFRISLSEKSGIFTFNNNITWLFQISNFELFSRILPRRIELRKNLNKNFEPEPLHRNTGYDLYENHTSTEYYCNLEGAIS
jgi:hypothetical protein